MQKLSAFLILKVESVGMNRMNEEGFWLLFNQKLQFMSSAFNNTIIMNIASPTLTCF